MGSNLIAIGLEPLGPQLIEREPRRQNANPFKGTMWEKGKMIEGWGNRF